MKLVEIKTINPNDEKEIVKMAEKCDLHYRPFATMFGLYVNDEIVSVSTAEETQNQILITFEYTKPEHRKKGYGSMLLKHTVDFCFQITDKKVVASCRPTSLNMHLLQGAIIVRKGKKGGAIVCHKKTNNEDI